MFKSIKYNIVTLKMEKFEMIYEQLAKLIKVEDYTPELAQVFLSTFDVNSFETIESLRNSGVFSIVDQTEFDNSDEQTQEYIRIVLAQLATDPESDTSGGVDLLSSSLQQLSGIDTSALDISDSHLAEASKMITQTLGLQSDGMSSLIQGMVGDIGKSLQSGMSINDLVTSLSQDFGNKLNAGVQNGTISAEEIKNSTDSMSNTFKGLTENPASLMKMVQGMTGGAPDTAEEIERKKQERREKLKQKWRNQRKANGRKRK